MRQFGELEAVIMHRLWAWGRPALVREMVDDLQKDRQIAYATVMTVMDNLHRKGWLRRHRDGRAWRYEPTGSRSGYTAALMSDGLATSPDRRTVAAALTAYAVCAGVLGPRLLGRANWAERAPRLGILTYLAAAWSVVAAAVAAQAVRLVGRPEPELGAVLGAGLTQAPV
jgi:predicted transcriptional regulator